MRTPILRQIVTVISRLWRPNDRARQEAETRYRSLIEQLPLITYIDSPFANDDVADYVSPQLQSILGYTPEEWCAVPDFFAQRLHPLDRDRVRTLQRTTHESGEPLEAEYRLRAADGSWVWLSDSRTIVLDDAGRPWYSQGFALDNLHDGPIQKLTVVAFSLDRLVLRIARNEPDVEELARELRERVRSEMVALRSLMTELRPPILDERDLVSDDGIGFDRASAGPSSFGLLGMEERIGSLGGRLRVTSSPGKGTRIEAALPWKSRALAPAA